MPILAECECGNRFPAGERDGGKRRQCPACGELVTIPKPEDAADDGDRVPAPAGWSWRALAILLDIILVAVPLAIALYAGGIEVPATIDENNPPPPEFALAAVLGFLLFPSVMIWLNEGRTLGKMYAGVRVVREDGSPVGFLQALGREALKHLFLSAGQVTAFLVPAVNFLWPMMDEHNRALHDIICGTRVIDTEFTEPARRRPEEDGDETD